MVPEILGYGGLILWLLIGLGAIAVLVFLERVLYYHREQINAAEFLNGVKNVLRRNNIVEALAICDATPGPVARLVKTAILNRERGKEGIQKAVEYAGLSELPRLEQRLPLLATIAQIAPLLGLFGTVLGLIDVFYAVDQASLVASRVQLAAGVWKGLVCTGAGLALGIPCYAAYNYLVSRMNSLLLDMEKGAVEIEQTLADLLLQTNSST